MTLGDLQETWDALGRDDPFGAILDPLRFRDDWTLDDFFATGEREIDDALAAGARYELPAGRRSALDFGCGAGRLTQAMVRHFERCVGVDIAPSMIELARRLNRHGDRVEYLLNESDSLGGLADSSFDFVYSAITLQHMQPALARRYIEEFVRVLAPAGLLVFQLPSSRETESVLPDSAFRAELTPLGRVQPAAGASAVVRLRVRNRGDAPWPADLPRRPLRVGNHWRDAAGGLLVLDDGRAALPRDVPPGKAVDVELAVTAPGDPGDYVLELDLVQESVAWFADRGSPTASIPVRVLPSVEPPSRSALVVQRTTDALRRLLPRRHPNGAGPSQDAAAPGDDGEAAGGGIEMYEIPEEEVRTLLEEADARVLEVAEDNAAGPGWISLRYVVTKDRP